MTLIGGPAGALEVHPPQPWARRESDPANGIQSSTGESYGAAPGLMPACCWTDSALTAAQVRAIRDRAAAGEKKAAIAREFGVTSKQSAT
jgi:hypothetical protein